VEGCGLCPEQGGLGSLVTRLLDKFEPRFAPPSAVLINSSVSFSLSFSFLSPLLQAAIVSTSFAGHYTLCRSSNHADWCHVACAFLDLVLIIPAPRFDPDVQFTTHPWNRSSKSLRTNRPLPSSSATTFSAPTAGRNSARAPNAIFVSLSAPSRNNSSLPLLPVATTVLLALN
jgi:hypothetical protein